MAPGTHRHCQRPWSSQPWARLLTFLEKAPDQWLRQLSWPAQYKRWVPSQPQMVWDYLQQHRNDNKAIHGSNKPGQTKWEPRNVPSLKLQSGCCGAWGQKDRVTVQGPSLTYRWPWTKCCLSLGCDFLSWIVQGCIIRWFLKYRPALKFEFLRFWAFMNHSAEYKEKNWF